ncbi:MAG: tripartite tricarboxylate transporter substrate-binding protein, partial [Burkholderiaceae bacterium]
WSAERLPEYPNIPTMMEKGIPYSMANWSGVFVPKDTPGEIIEKISTALQAALKDPKVLSAMENLKVPIGHLGPKDFAAFAQKDYEQNRQLLQDAGLLKK